MYVRILRERGPRVRLPEHGNYRRDEALHLRGQMQLLFQLHLQDQLRSWMGAAHFGFGPRCSAGSGKCAAFLLKKEQKSNYV
jgi:hypothetical protein